MYSVIKLDPNTELYRKQLSEEKSFVMSTKKSVCYAVVNGEGEIIKSQNGQFEIYKKKSTALEVASFKNKQSA